MIKVDKQHHKIVRTSQVWGEWEYTYYERHRQISKARELSRKWHKEKSEVR